MRPTTTADAFIIFYILCAWAAGAMYVMLVGGADEDLLLFELPIPPLKARYLLFFPLLSEDQGKDKRR